MPIGNRVKERLARGGTALCMATRLARTPEIAELKHPKLREAYETTMRACAAHGKCLGIGGIRADVSHVAELVQLGARFVIAASDIQYLMAAARSEVAALRKAAGG